MQKFAYEKFNSSKLNFMRHNTRNKFNISRS